MVTRSTGQSQAGQQLKLSQAHAIAYNFLKYARIKRVSVHIAFCFARLDLHVVISLFLKCLQDI